MQTVLIIVIALLTASNTILHVVHTTWAQQIANAITTVMEFVRELAGTPPSVALTPAAIAAAAAPSSH